MYKILTIMGTRPEAIKLFPFIRKLQSDNRFESVVASTGQQGATLGGIVKELGIKVNHLGNVLRHDLMPEGGNTLTTTEVRVMNNAGSLVRHVNPDMVVVHGDTATAFASTQSIALSGYPVAHIEAGNRSGNKQEPFPEEINRRVIAIWASLHFPSTDHAKQNLLKENIPESRIHVTGSTIVDSMRLIMGDNIRPNFSDASQRQILVTMHRKENMEQGNIDRVADAVINLLKTDPTLSVKWLTPSNPNALPSNKERLGKLDRFEFIAPQKYRDFLSLMQNSSLIITDSGGIQEESYVLGTPIIVARAVTERPEAFNQASMALINPNNPQAIVEKAQDILNSDALHKPPTSNVFGDGHAVDIIADEIFKFCQLPRELPHPKENPEFYRDYGY